MLKNLLISALLLSAVGAYAQSVPETLTVPTGQIIAENGKMRYQSFRGETVNIPVDDQPYLLSFEKVVSQRSGEVTTIFVQQSSGGTACPATFFIYEIDVHGKSIRSPSFGTCSDLLQVRQKGTTFLMSLPQAGGKKPVNYKWEHGILSENGKVLK